MTVSSLVSLKGVASSCISLVQRCLMPIAPQLTLAHPSLRYLSHTSFFPSPSHPTQAQPSTPQFTPAHPRPPHPICRARISRRYLRLFLDGSYCTYPPESVVGASDRFWGCLRLILGGARISRRCLRLILEGRYCAPPRIIFKVNTCDRATLTFSYQATVRPRGAISKPSL